MKCPTCGKEFKVFTDAKEPGEKLAICNNPDCEKAFQPQFIKIQEAKKE
jgi:protein tyrosine phosphatase (PTP) superfamily phosphohydrolase (DUF442 family)